MNTSKHQCYDTIGDTPFIRFMDTTKTSNQDIETTEPYITNNDTDIVVCLGVIKNELFRAIDDKKGASVNIEMVDPDITIGETDETSEHFIDDIVFNWVEGVMWRPTGHHIERGCETSLLLCPYIKDIQTSYDVWLKCIPLTKKVHIRECAAQPRRQLSSLSLTDDNGDI